MSNRSKNWVLLDGVRGFWLGQDITQILNGQKAKEIAGDTRNVESKFDGREGNGN